jgi:beta-galactosidase
VQPNYGLDKVFGATQSYVEFIPDISEDITLTLMNAKIYGRYFRQQYALSGGEEAGQFPDGKTAAVAHTFGKGRTLLIGSFPGSGYYLHHEPATRELFATFPALAGIEPVLKTDNTSVQARLHKGTGGTHLWVTNPTWSDQRVAISFGPSVGNFRSAEDIWGQQSATLESQKLSVTIPARDAVVLVLT